MPPEESDDRETSIPPYITRSDDGNMTTDRIDTDALPRMWWTNEWERNTPYRYYATLDRVVDGDTIDLTVDLGFSISYRIRARLVGIDTHETFGVAHDSAEYAKGVAEADFVEAWLTEATQLLVATKKDRTGKYGRYLATIFRYTEDGWEVDSLNAQLVGVFGTEVLSK
jgi:micrococcal nuclease